MKQSKDIFWLYFSYSISVMILGIICECALLSGSGKYFVVWTICYIMLCVISLILSVFSVKKILKKSTYGKNKMLLIPLAFSFPCAVVFAFSYIMEMARYR